MICELPEPSERQIFQKHVEADRNRAACSPGLLLHVRGGHGGNLHLQTHCVLVWEPFRGPGIKASVIDVLLNWIFHVFHTSPRRFSTLVICLSVRVVSRPHTRSVRPLNNGPFWLQTSSSASASPELLNVFFFFFVIETNRI